MTATYQFAAEARREATARDAVASLRRSISKAQAATAKARRNAIDAYGRISGRMEPLLKGQSYGTLAGAMLLGLLAGLLIANSRPQIIYVKPRE